MVVVALSVGVTTLVAIAVAAIIVAVSAIAIMVGMPPMVVVAVVVAMPAPNGHCNSRRNGKHGSRCIVVVAPLMVSGHCEGTELVAKT